MREISITELQNLKIGQAENAQAGTGCTVFLLGETGAPVGLDVRGGGPASRESELLKPTAAAQVIHAILLGGGSAFGLDAAGGVMRYLEEHDIGFDVGVTKVPLVCQSDLFDLTVGDAHTRPDAAMAYQACVNAETGNYRDGNYGAGTGATVGKLLGMPHCMKSGIGSYAVQVGPLQVGAVFTNSKFDKAHLCKIAAMTHDGYARAIRPVHTANDGDSIYAVSLGDLAADQDVVGALAARVMAEAILRAVQAADSAYGFPAAKDLKR